MLPITLFVGIHNTEFKGAYTFWRNLILTIQGRTQLTQNRITFKRHGCPKRMLPVDRVRLE